MSATTKNIELKNIQTNRLSDWGLIPDHEDDEHLDIKKVLHHFFVEFNPLYLISALCIFYGVVLVANNLDVIDQATNISGQLILFAVLQAYEAMIIAGIAFLTFKAHAIRPAVILCLLECVLIFDCTFRLESLSLMGSAGIALSCVWLVLVLIKSWLIAKIMQLKMSSRHYASIAAAALSLAITIELFSQAWVDKVLLLQISAWIGAFILLTLIFNRPALTSKLATSSEHKETAEKCINAGFIIIAGFYFYHTLAFLFFAADSSIRGLAIIPQFTAITLLLTIIKSKESDIIKYASLTLLLGLAAPIGIAYTCFILAAVLLYHLSDRLHDNYAILSVFLCYGGYCLLGWEGLGGPLPSLPELASLPTVLLGLSLLTISVFFRNIAALSITLAAVCYVTFNSIGSILPSSELGRGIVILTSGFVVFVLGLAINWWLRADSVTQSGMNHD